MEVTELFDRCAEATTDASDVAEFRDRAYDTLGRLLISLAYVDLPKTLTDDYADTVRHLFSHMPAHLRFNATPDAVDALRQQLPEEVEPLVEDRLDVI